GAARPRTIHRARARVRHPCCDGALLCRSPYQAGVGHDCGEQRDHQAGGDREHGSLIPVAAYDRTRSPERTAQGPRCRWSAARAPLAGRARAREAALAGGGGVTILRAGRRRALARADVSRTRRRSSRLIVVAAEPRRHLSLPPRRSSATGRSDAAGLRLLLLVVQRAPAV